LRKAQFLQCSAVERVEEIAAAFPGDAQRKQPIVRRIADRLTHLPSVPPQMTVMPPEQLQQLLGRMQVMVQGSPDAAALGRQLGQLGGLVAEMPATEYYQRMTRYQQCLAEDLLGRLRALAAASNPEPPQLGDLPDGLTSRFVGRTGKYLLRVYSKADIWKMAAMQQFVDQIRRVDKQATGNPLQVYEASRQMKRSYDQATLLAAVTIIPVVLFNFGALGHTLLAMLPLILGSVQMFGIMGILDIPLNPANMMGLPLMLGMGVDNGVHIMHDFRSQRGRYQMSPSTSVAVVLNTLTTMVGFAVLIIADHRGLQSLGRVLTIGMTCCLFSALVVLPCLLAWITRHRSNEEEKEDEEADRSEAVELDSRSSPVPAIYRRDPSHGLPESHLPVRQPHRRPVESHAAGH
jgi:preprotein translocase subunit SecF